jgi:ATP-binding cassette subfamily B (MDR/TAP) protein 1
MSCFFTNAEKQVHQIRKMYFASILNQDIAYFDSNEVGKLTQQMSGGIDRIQNGISDKILILTRSFSSLIAGIIIAFNLNWQMTLLMLLILPIVILTIWGSSKVSQF